MQLTVEGKKRDGGVVGVVVAAGVAAVLSIFYVLMTCQVKGYGYSWWKSVSILLPRKRNTHTLSPGLSTLFHLACLLIQKSDDSFQFGDIVRIWDFTQILLTLVIY